MDRNGDGNVLKEATNLSMNGRLLTPRRARKLHAELFFPAGSQPCGSYPGRVSDSPAEVSQHFRITPNHFSSDSRSPR